jgi:hypothetical protein
MNKYKIEGNIDFFEELYKSLDNEEDLDEDTNTCLITNQLLTDKFIQLQCGHKFNYIPIFLDIKNHKQKFNSLEGNSTRLDNNEIRCPYCRNKHSGVLPFYEEFGYAKINGVNHYDPSVKGYQGYSYKQCEYLSLNPIYDPSGNLPLETNKSNIGNVKFFVCYASGSKINIEEESELNNDNKCYCYKHKNLVIKAHNKKLSEKAKEEAKAKKMLEKQQAKEQKEALKEEKAKAKELKKKNKNIVISVATDESKALEETTGCVEILKSGLNKGKPCGCNIIIDNLCNRHFKIKNNIITNNI